MHIQSVCVYFLLKRKCASFKEHIAVHLKISDSWSLT